MNKEEERQSFQVQEPRQASNPGVAETSPLIVSTATSDKEVSVNNFLKSGKELRKSLGFKHAFSYIISILFGSGIFISPSLVAKQTSNMGMAMVVWVISGITSLFGALCFCELACMYKKTGTYYLFILEAYGEVVGFMIIWTEILIVSPSAYSILSIAIGQHIIEPFYDITSPSGVWLVKAVAIFSIFLAALLNCISTTLVAKSQIFFSIVQSLSVSFLVVLGVWQLASGHTENYTVMFDNSQEFSIGGFGLALYNGLWAYDGWGSTVAVAEELQNLDRDLWLAFITGIPFVIICYLFVNLALMSALSRSEIIASSTVATTFVAKVLGRKASLIIPVCVALSCFGCCVGAMFFCSRISLSAAREGQLPHFLCFIHKDRRTPIPALLAELMFTLFWILPATNGLEDLITYFSIAVWLKYGIAIFSVLVMRKKKPNLPRPFKVWLTNPIFTSLFSLFLVGVPFIKRPVESSICLLLFLSALPVYYAFIRKHDKMPSCLHTATTVFYTFLVQRCNLTPCIFKEQTKDGYCDMTNEEDNIDANDKSNQDPSSIS